MFFIALLLLSPLLVCGDMGSIDLVLLHSVRKNANERNAKISANLKINDKLPEYLLRRAFSAVEVFVEDQEIYKNNTRNVISKYKMEVHCSENGTYYEIISHLQGVLNADILTAIAVDNIHSYHHLRAIVLDLIEVAEVVTELCRVFLTATPSNAKTYQPWSLPVFTKRLQSYIYEVDDWIRSTSDEMKLASKTLHAEFLCRRSLKARAKSMKTHLAKTLPQHSWAVICQHQTGAVTEYAEYANSGQFYNVTAGLHEKRCTAFAADKKEPTPPAQLLERLEACRQNVTNKNEIADDSVAMLRKIIDDCHPEADLGNKQIIMVTAHEKFPGGVAIDADADNFRELIIRRNGAIVQRILLGWEVQPSREQADDIAENRDGKVIKTSKTLHNSESHESREIA